MTDDTEQSDADETDAQPDWPTEPDPPDSQEPDDDDGSLVSIPSRGDDDDEEEWEPEGALVEYDRPRMDTRYWKQLYRTRKHLKNREKLIGDGYVEWVLVGDTVQRKFIKPSREGGGVPEYEHGDSKYLFPRDALVPTDDGMWTCVHREGEADPIPISDPAEHAIPSDVLKEYLDRSVSTSPPGLLDSLGLDSGDLLKFAIAGIIIFAVLQNTGMF